VNLLCAAGTRDEKQNLENLTATRHRQNLCHPGADPLEVLGGLDDPHKCQAAGSDGAVGVTSDNVTHVRNLVRDTDTGCPQHDGAIGAEVLAAVGTLDEGRGRETARSRQISLAEQLVGEASAPSHNEGHAGLGLLENVLAVHGKVLLISVREVLLLLAPSDREGVVGPEANSRHVEVGVLSRTESPWAGHADSDAKSVTRKDLDIGLGTALTDIVHNDASKANESLHSPESDYTVEHELLRALVQVNPDCAQSKRGTNNVAVQENLVEGVADRRWRLDQKEDKCNSALGCLLDGDDALGVSLLTMKPLMMNVLPLMDA
jgi:hypothetical protein